MKSVHFLLFRILTSIIFLYAGVGHVINKEKILAKFNNTKIYKLLPSANIAETLIMLTGIVMIVASLMLATGLRQRLAAIILLLVLIPITLSVQLENFKDLGPFFKNVAIAGSLLFIINYKKQIYESENISSLHSNAAG